MESTAARHAAFTVLILPPSTLHHPENHRMRPLYATSRNFTLAPPSSSFLIDWHHHHHQPPKRETSSTSAALPRHHLSDLQTSRKAPPLLRRLPSPADALSTAFPPPTTPPATCRETFHNSQLGARRLPPRFYGSFIPRLGEQNRTWRHTDLRDSRAPRSGKLGFDLGPAV